MSRWRAEPGSGWTGGGLALAMAPLLGGLVYAAWFPRSAGAGTLRALLSMFCHQEPSRCFWVAGAPMCLCHRCVGIYAGIALGALGTAAARRSWHAADPAHWKPWVLFAAPIFVHVLVPAGHALDAWWLQLGTGALFGVWAGHALSVAFARIVRTPRASS